MGNRPVVAEERPLGLTVIEIISVNNLPNMDVGSLTDAYLILSFRSGSNPKARLGGIEVKTQTKNNNLNPIFHSFEEFPFIPQESDCLSIKILDHDVTSKDDKVGKVFIPMPELLRLSEITTPLNMQTSVKTVGLTTVTLRLVYTGPRPSTKIQKTVFLIRHGESKWNESQSEKNLMGMVTQYDHELTQVGIEQAESFNQRWRSPSATSHEADIDDYQTFCNATAIFASPLTRATQTALIACEGHGALQHPKELILLSNIREVKNFGSFDTVGKYSGNDIAKHVEEMIKRDINEEKATNILKPSINPNDAQEQWWTALEIQETHNDVNLRLKELWNYLRYGTDETSIILVGHSHYFRQMMRQYLSQEYRSKEPEWTHSLDKKKLDNASCLRVTVTWNYPENVPEVPPPVIEYAKLVFDSRLIGEGDDEDDDEEEEEKSS